MSEPSEPSENKERHRGGPLDSRPAAIIAIIISSVIILALGRAGGALLMRAVSVTPATPTWRAADEPALYAGEEAQRVAAGIPHPPSSRLLFAGTTGGVHPGESYRFVSEVAMEAVVEYYRTEMPRRGWRELRGHSDSYSEEYEGVALVFARAGERQAMIWISPGEYEGPTMVTLMIR